MTNSVNSTCKFLSNGYRFEIDQNNRSVLLSPCCKWDGGPTLPLYSLPVQYKKYRELVGNINSNESPYCHICNYADSKNIPSMRKTLANTPVFEGAEFGDPSFLEIQIDRTCNAACIMCGPQFSSVWAQELKIPILPKIRVNYVEKIMRAVDPSKIRKINFLGGEPFLLDDDLHALEKIPDPSKVYLFYSTNGSIYPSKEKIALWKNFKRVVVSFSIDGVGSRFEYIRYPLSWQQVIDNMKRAQDSMPPNVVLKICHTVNFFNLYYYDEFLDWSDSIGQSEGTISYNPAFGILSPSKVTPALKELIDLKYGADHCVTNTVSSTDLDPKQILCYITELDQRRKSNWRSVFPEIASCL